MFSSFFTSSQPKLTPTQQIEAKIDEYTVKITHENLAYNRKKDQLQVMVSGGTAKVVLKTAPAVRLIRAMKRQKDVISAYQTSLEALENTLTNIKLQTLTADVQATIGRGSRGDIDLDAADDTMADTQEMAEQREMLARMMATNAEADDELDEFIESLGLEETPNKAEKVSAPPVYATTALHQIPEVPATTPLMPANTISTNEDPQPVASAVALPNF